jgi:predicted nuclease of predicted toxin-antitoxin system
MQFLANENYPLKSVHLLREAGYDVRAIIEDSPGIDDKTVLSQAKDESRIILTFDRDYGELVYRHKQPIPIGIIYFRFDPTTPEEPAEYLLEVLKLEALIIENKFTIIERNRIRQRPLL